MATNILCELCGRQCKGPSGYRQHMNWHVQKGDISKDSNIGRSYAIMSSDEISEDYLLASIQRVLRGNAAAIHIEHKKIQSKKRIGKQVLVITPGVLFGDVRVAVFGLLGGGCEAMKIDDLKVTPLIRLGLPNAVAVQIVKAFEALN